MYTKKPKFYPFMVWLIMFEASEKWLPWRAVQVQGFVETQGYIMRERLGTVEWLMNFNSRVEVRYGAITGT